MWKASCQNFFIVFLVNFLLAVFIYLFIFFNALIPYGYAPKEIQHNYALKYVRKTFLA